MASAGQGARLLGGMLLVAAALGVGGCKDRRIDLRNIEAAMGERYGRDAKVPVREVSCPPWVRTREGERIACEVVFEGDVRWTVAVIQGPDGNTRWQPQGQVVFADDIEAWLQAQQAEGAAEGAGARCPARVYVLEDGDSASCTVSGAEGERAVAVTVDEQGELRQR
ncbi:DUF4333 domain-containing protein [Haliangium ochraceum]|uniref:DUF4333 domain-containing protein n=1 Tax=Haliangium ochraceum (strain DSM 14365 / JCM 11303 / SMP-2) TaxID=502025 RepID=D0LGR6_HALO1|nr:DUF4333 domain-containing protein [Haliangium ochraceum]ACY14638.1 hypothetical protein Hoch_2093 [Haliangium ochraceum DSM 14365]